jgi:hypothetical protein
VDVRVENRCGVGIEVVLNIVIAPPGDRDLSWTQIYVDETRSIKVASKPLKPQLLWIRLPGSQAETRLRLSADDFEMNKQEDRALYVVRDDHCPHQ